MIINVKTHKHMYDFNNKVLSVETDTHILTLCGCLYCDKYMVYPYVKGENMGLNGSTHFVNELEKLLNKLGL